MYLCWWRRGAKSFGERTLGERIIFCGKQE
jgi:hypothetical protein